MGNGEWGMGDSGIKGIKGLKGFSDPITQSRNRSSPITHHSLPGKSQRSSNTRVSAFVQHVDKAKDSIELPIRAKNTMILLYKTGFQVLTAIM